MPIIPIEIPDSVLEWVGNAADLAAKCLEIMPIIGPAGDEDAPNERLIRHYVQVGVLTPPVREGKEARFAGRQVIEFVVARHLLKQGWPLAKIGEILRATSLPELAGVGEPPVRTPAEQAIARIKERPSPMAAVAFATAPQLRARAVMSAGAPGMLSAPGAPSVAVNRAAPFDDSAARRRAFEIAHRRNELRESLTSLGNESGEPERARTLRISLTSWCRVYVDADRLNDIDDDAATLLGTSLARALQEERIQSRKGEKT